MAVSANTLFHFTKKDRLKKILQDSFFPQYSLEDLSNVTPDASIYKVAYTPMVCFCDLVFSQIKKHIEFYGDYGIGLRKEGWGKAKGISPIVYVPEKSISASLIYSMATQIATKLKNEDDKDAILKELHNFYTYVKPYNGLVLNKKSKKMEERIFYNEREWRYVPKDFPVLSEQFAKKEDIESANNEMFKHRKLNFSAKDIKYIIVKTEKEILEFMDFIETDLKERFPKEAERKLLVSKLISVNQIDDDM